MKKIFLAFSILLFLFVLTEVINAQSNSVSSQDNDEKYYASSEVDTKIIISSKPKQAKAINCSEQSGKVKLQVYFHKSGKVTKTDIITPSSCKTFDDNAVKSAEKIKFKPATKNGNEVNYVTEVEYEWKM